MIVKNTRCVTGISRCSSRKQDALQAPEPASPQHKGCCGCSGGGGTARSQEYASHRRLEGRDHLLAHGLCHVKWITSANLKRRQMASTCER